MRRLKLTGFAVIAILALAAMAMAGTATALEILPTPSAEKPLKFTDKGGKGELSTLLEVLGHHVVCLKNTSKGEFTSATLGTIEIKFAECKAGEFACVGLADEKEKITFKGAVHFTDGLLSEKQVAAFAILVTEDLHFSCSIILLKILAGSCQAGLVLENSLDKLVEKAFVSFLLKEKILGDTDIPFINLPTEAACELKVSVNEAKEEDMGAILQEEEEIEGFEQGKAKVTLLLHTK